MADSPLKGEPAIVCVTPIEHDGGVRGDWVFPSRAGDDDGIHTLFSATIASQDYCSGREGLAV